MAAAKIGQLETDLGNSRTTRNKAENSERDEQNQFNEVMGRFHQCLTPAWAKSVVPDVAIPDDLDASVALLLRQQSQLHKLDGEVDKARQSVEKELGSDYSGADDIETARLLREELEALADKENALGREWEFLLHALRATFDQVLRSLSDIGSAATNLNRRLSSVRVSSLAALHMNVVEQSDMAASLRRLVNIEQPGLFDDSSGLEAAIDGFRKKFEANPLLRYSDLFSLRFTVTGDDGEPHHYDDLDQVESHGTTITIKVLFNLLVLRSLLREDAFAFSLTDKNSYSLRGACALVENPVVFAIIERLCLPFNSALYGRGRISSRMLDWLAEMTASECKLIHLPDYDPVGLNEFARLRARLGERVALHLPANLSSYFARFSNRTLLEAPNTLNQLRNLSASPDPEIRAVLRLIHHHNAGLEQEALLLPLPEE